ncbi:exo-alpha-sialidase [Dyadobacter tibetensis]|uniref:exo-alpha-sialidase n=1 Tax=Dyadobacter tibetensis TaxID=1211851 RepID=UPI00046F92D3|nr:exo-alpha-sialidase [Dyadobacter tibetensis]
MLKESRIILGFYCLLLTCLNLSSGYGQDTVRYKGTTMVNVDYHDGRLRPAVGVHSFQTFRANREHQGRDSTLTWTYNHAPMMAYWNHRFYINYLSNPIGEHIPPGQSMLQTSTDGKQWSSPVVVFPPYKIPDGARKVGHPGVARDLTAVMHQRMAFFVSGNGKLLALGYYGMVLDSRDDPNDGKGVGRVIREIHRDGSFGPIYFIRPNKSWKYPLTYPLFSDSGDKDFIKACQELLSNRPMVQQWVEEADRDDPLIALQKQYKAFSYYHLNDGRMVGLWKSALTSTSSDGGNTWEFNPTRAPGFVNSNAKIWGQKTADGRYVTVYNPSEFRWPLALSVSDNGLEYKNLLLVNGEISGMRYGGNYKSYGPQYVRGIVEGNGIPPDGKLWVTYSMNKEDIWVSSIPVPITADASQHAEDFFTREDGETLLSRWNIYSPLWASVGIRTNPRNVSFLNLLDSDPFDYARAERIIPPTRKLEAEWSVTPAQSTFGHLDMEILDAVGTVALRLTLDSTGKLQTKAGYRQKELTEYQAEQSYKIKVKLDVQTRIYSLEINGRNLGNHVLFAPVSSISRVVFRTGPTRRFPNADTPTDQDYDLPDAGGRSREAGFGIDYLITRTY